MQFNLLLLNFVLLDMRTLVFCIVVALCLLVYTLSLQIADSSIGFERGLLSLGLIIVKLLWMSYCRFLWGKISEISSFWWPKVFKSSCCEKKQENQKIPFLSYKEFKSKGHFEERVRWSFFERKSDLQGPFQKSKGVSTNQVLNF